MKKKIIIYTDGACSNNQSKENKGGWGAVLMYGEHEKHLSGGEANTTNNRMELMAIIKAFEEIKNTEIDIVLHSDSAYFINCMTQKWYVKWRSNGWVNAKKNPIENQDLWFRILDLIENKFKDTRIEFVKVKGHSGDKYNEIADMLAREGAAQI